MNTMSVNSQLLRQIPKVDDLLRLLQLSELDCPHPVLTEAVRETIEQLRQQILAGETPSLDPESICSAILHLVQKKTTMSLRPVINATGIVLHTNLGRAKLSDKAVEAIRSVAQDYNTLEYNLEKGARGSRYAHVENLIAKITGAEAAMVVNNNAAAVMLVLSTMVKGKEVITSRGELVEIGGAFRVPEIMQQSGGTLVEVGTTNKTHLSDYVNAINENTGALLKVHTSNFKIMGFFEEVTLEQMVELGHQKNIPVIYDLGSGAMIRLSDYGIQDEPNVLDSVKSGADVVSFSGDKLLGGPQAGIIVGRKKYLAPIKSNPLIRALRVDKMTLAALEATLILYRDGRAPEIPTVAMLSADPDRLRAKAIRLLDALEGCPARITLSETASPVGGGSMPDVRLSGWVVEIAPEAENVDTFLARLREQSPAVLGYIREDRACFDPRTIRSEDLDETARLIKEALL